MDNITKSCTVTLDEFKAFHGIDRALYTLLVRELCRNPLECLYVMGLWLWFERIGNFYSFISKTLTLPPSLINEIADEAVACLRFMNNQFPFSSAATEIPLTHSVANKDTIFQFLRNHQFSAFSEIHNLIQNVCIPAFSDIVVQGGHHAGLNQSPIQRSAGNVAVTSPAFAQTFEQSISSSRLDMGNASASNSSYYRAPTNNETSRDERTMFVTFSRGFPVFENEVRPFFTSLFGDCVESFNMHEVKSANEQPLFAKIVFSNPLIVTSLLQGVTTAKFNINGKHVWMRKYEPRRNLQN